MLDSGVEWEFTAVWDEDDEADSRTSLRGNGTSVWWVPKDEVNLFYGIQSGKFTSTNSEEAKSTTFKGSFTEISVGQEINSSEFWAVYPYDASNTYDGQSVTLSVSSFQTVKDHKFTGRQLLHGSFLRSSSSKIPYEMGDRDTGFGSVGMPTRVL